MAIEEVDRKFPKKNGTEGREAGLSVRDLSADGPRCVNNITYLWGKGEEDKYKGKLRDRFLTIAISELRAGFGGAVQANGCIMEIEGPIDQVGNGSVVASAPVKGGK